MTVLHCTKCGQSLSAQQAGEPCPHCGSRERDFNGVDRAVVIDKATVAKELAKRHFELESGLTRIIRFSGELQVEATPAEPIKLLEINAATVPSGVMPLHFGPAPASGIRFPSVIIEVTPEEFQRIEARELKLPEGWQTPDDLPKPVEV